MIQKKYLEFFDSLNENIQQAKVYLKNLALKKKKEAAGETDQPVGLSADEVRLAETNPNFLKIKDMCRDVPGYTFLFTKIYFEELDPNQDYTDQEKFDTVKNLFDRVKNLGNLVKDLPMALDRYAAIKPTEEDQRPISERIDDDIDKLMLEKSYKKFYNELLPNQKKWVEEAIQQQKDKLREIGIAFGEMGKDENGKIDPVEQKSLHRVFYSKLGDFQKLDDLIDYAINYIKSVENNQFSKFVSKIDKLNTKVGPQNGARVIYNKDGYLIIEVMTYIANRELNGHTSHCIARSGSYWDSYLESYNKQYYLYNFNLDSSNKNSVIGMTIRPDGSMRAAHDKLDGNVLSSFKQIIKEYGIPFEFFAPMTKEEMEIKKKRIEASKKIIESNISLEDAIKSLEDGADPNAKGGIPLKNAVKADNLELTSLLLKKGALPNMTDQSSSDTAITYSKNLEMVKLLVSYGATLNSAIFRNLATDSEAVEYLLKAGLDPNFERGFPFRSAAKANNLSTMKLLMKYADNIPGDKLSLREKQLIMLSERRFMALKWAVSNGSVESTIFILEKLKELNYDDFTKDPESFIKGMIDFASTSDAMSDQDKSKMVESLKNLMKNQSGDNVRESRKLNSFSEFKVK
jgi:ankyrin repeat protein